LGWRRQLANLPIVLSHPGEPPVRVLAAVAPRCSPGTTSRNGVFAKVVAKQSFSGAARELRLSQAAVSKHVRALEDWLGARSLDRTTRRLNVTEIGALVYQRCERILDEIDEVRQSTSALQTVPRGVLHLAAPVSFGITQLGPALADYLVRYPEVVVDVTLDDRFIDVVEEGFDLALRVGALKNSSLIARRLATVRFVLLRIPRLCRHRPCSDFYRGQGPCGRSPDRADARIPTG